MIKDNPDFHDIRFLLANTYIRLNNYSEAKNELLYITNSNPSYYDAWILLGNIFFWENNYEHAIEKYDQAIKGEYNEQLYLNKAKAHFILNQLNDAELLLNRIIKDEKNHTEAVKLKDEIDLLRAINSIKSENYNSALPIIKKYVEKYPEHTEARFRLGQLYYFIENNDSAKHHLNIIYQIDSTNQDVLKIMQNIAFIEEKYEDALKYVNKLILYNPNDEQLLMRKAQILRFLGRYKESEKTIEKILENNPDNAEAENFLYELVPLIYPNLYTISYRIDAFRANSEVPNYHLFYFQYTRYLSDDVLVARINRANWGELTGFQFEADFYKIINDSYLYFNFGLSNGVLFPDLRLGAEYYHNFSRGFEASIGLRYLKFDTTAINLYTVSISEYYKDFLFGYRYYFVPISQEIFSTHVFSIRKYSNLGNFIGFQYIRGNSHDDSFIVASDFYQLQTQAFRLEVFRRINPFWSFQINGAYMIEETSPEIERERFSIELLINRAF